MNEKDLNKINYVLEMLNNINDIEMEEIIDEFNNKNERKNYLNISSAYHMQNILNSFNALVEIYYMHKDI